LDEEVDSVEENGCYSCGAETFNACGCEDKDAETYESQGRTKKKTLIFVDLSGSTMQRFGSNKPLLHSWKDHLASLGDDGEYTIVGLGSAGGDRLLLKDGTASEIAQLSFPSMGGTKPLTKEIVQKYSNMIGKHNDMIYYTDALEYDKFGLAAETFGSENFDAEGGEIRTGAMYGAGAVVGITGATIVLGALMSLFSRRS
jgi:hypothetical protein